MALLPILRFPDPRLKKIAAPVTNIDDSVRRLIADMAETMYEAPGIGLAATQVDVHHRIVVIDVSEDKSELRVFINPTLGRCEGAQVGEEGCLSVPGLRGMVPRWQHLRYQGLDAHGQPIDRIVSGFHARVIQHECDHLWGVLYPMRVRDFSQFGFTDVLFPDLAH